MPSKNILLADDISSSSRHGKKRSYQLRNLAAHLSVAMKAQLHFLYVEDIPEHLRKREKLLSLEKRNPKLIDKLKKKLEKISSNYKIHIESGAPVQKILDCMQELDAELIVIATRGKKGVSKLFLGSVAEEVIRNSSCPVVVLGPQVLNVGLGTPDRKTRILLLTDLQASSKPAEDFTKKIAKQLHAQVTVFHSVGDPIMHIKNFYYQSAVTNYSLDEDLAAMKTWARQELTKRSEQFKKEGLSVRTRFIVDEHAVEKDLKRELVEDYDLVVMGTHSRNKIISSFIGSTARKTCLMSPAPVAIVRSK
ncbi:Universal stress protein E [compost metagenome]